MSMIWHFLRSRWPLARRHDERAAEAPQVSVAPAPSPQFDIARDDPILDFFAHAPGPVTLEDVTLPSPALTAMKSAGVQLVVPLINQGELAGLIYLGPRLSQQEYSRDDRALLSTLALQAAPAVRAATLAQQRQAEAILRERLEQEMSVAKQIQLALLPKEDPLLPGYTLTKFYRPARAVGGDFYDFIELADGKLGIVIGDVSDKGVPAALVMATTRSVLRGVARRHASPGIALGRANDILTAEIPPHMFVTCFYAVLDPVTGQLRFANAGQDWPLRRGAGTTDELRARGMPLGLMAGMTYEENEIVVEMGDCVLLYSDGIVEAHDPARQLLGFERLREWVMAPPSGERLISALMQRLAEFTGPAWEQEDDITMVTIERALPGTHLLCAFSVPSKPGNERIVMARVTEAVHALTLPSERLEGLRTATAEATMNAIEYGNSNNPELTVAVEVWVSDAQVRVCITDHVAGETIPAVTAPNLEAKLAGRQSPRGWGLYLIRHLVDEVRFSRDPGTCFLTTELILHRTLSAKGANTP